ncbi:MAG: hypothetical protein JWR07_4797 [Nevskia sp.]|nr:hypothetical protein [Nevskia sp.]
MAGPAVDEAARQSNTAALRAMAARDFAGAREILRKALLLAGDVASLWLNLAACCRALSDIEGALEAIQGALRADPWSFTALLMKGSLLERQGKSREAARIYGLAMALEPPQETMDAPTSQAFQHARAMNARYVDELVAFVEAEIGVVREKGSSAESGRMNQFMDLTLRRRNIYRQEPTDFYYPGLPVIEFYERNEFPWIEAFESATGAIQIELQNLLRQDFREFAPYVALADGVPVRQWAELNRSARWGALHLHLAGVPVEENCRRCPQTAAVLSALPQPRMPGRSPMALFSVLQPQTRIPAHTGIANTRLTVHLGLRVPSGCGFRVGNEKRTWREGQAWVFDDSIEHEAWNDSLEARVILICDVWNPRLGQAECDMIAGLVHAMDRFNGLPQKNAF